MDLKLTAQMNECHRIKKIFKEIFPSMYDTLVLTKAQLYMPVNLRITGCNKTQDPGPKVIPASMSFKFGNLAALKGLLGFNSHHYSCAKQLKRTTQTRDQPDARQCAHSSPIVNIPLQMKTSDLLSLL